MIKNIDDFVIKNRNMVSFSKVNLEIPFTSIFAKRKLVNISIVDPKFVFEEDVFTILGDIFKKRKRKGKGQSAVAINRITIKKGEIIYRTPKLLINLLDFNLEHSFKTSDITLYRLKSPHLKVVFPISKTEVNLEGDLLAEIKQQRGSWKINRLLWNTEHVKITMNGRVFNDKTASLNASLQGSLKQILDPMLKRMSIREFLYGNAKIRRNKEGKISVNAQFKANTFSVAGEPFTNLTGDMNWDHISNKYLISAAFNDGNFYTNLKVTSQNKITDVLIENVSAEKMAQIIDITDSAPLGGILKQGDFTVKKGEISGTALLEKGDMIDENHFYAAGLIDFNYYTKRKALKLHADEVNTEFGKASLTADSDPGKRERFVIHVDGDVNAAENLDKYTRYYTNLRLAPWKLRGGKGKVKLDVKKIAKNFFIETDFFIRDFTSGEQEVASLQGRVSSKSGVSTGYFEIEDKDLSGRAEMLFDKDGTRITFRNVAGESQKALRVLGFDIDLKGWMTGDFTYQGKPGETYPLVQGNFFGKKITFYGFDFDDVTGNLESRDYVHLKNLECFYKDGKGNADIFINFYTKIYKIKGAIGGIAIDKMHGEFNGRGDISFAGEGSFGKEKLADNDPINVDYKSDSVAFYKDQDFSVRGDAKIYTDFSDFMIKPGEKGGEILNKMLSSPFTIEFNRVKDRYSGNFTLNLQDINLLIPWGNNRGVMELKGQILSSETGNIRTEGYATFNGQFLSFPNFPHTLDDFSGDLIFKDLDFTLRSLRGTIGGGEVESSGYLTIKDDKLGDFFFDFHGKEMLLYPMDRTSCRLNTRDLTLRYIKAEDKILLSGVLNFPTALWERELDEEISFGTASSLSTSGSKFIEMLKFDLKLIGRKNFHINNSLLKGNGKFDLKLTGTSGFPLVNGTIDFGEGYLEMSDNKFELMKAKARFKNNNASVDLESETFIKNYRIKFNVRGTLSHLKPEFQSNPPLPPRDILTLLSLGELFERPTTTELSSQIGTGTTGLIAQEITEQIKKRTKKIFGDYVLRINPNITNIAGASVEGSSRVIVGKSIARDVLIVYSTNFSTQRQEVVYVQYQLSPTVSLIGKRNENGRFSIDIRFRRRH